MSITRLLPDKDIRMAIAEYCAIKFGWKSGTPVRVVLESFSSGSYLAHVTTFTQEEAHVLKVSQTAQLHGESRDGPRVCEVERYSPEHREGVPESGQSDGEVQGQEEKE